MSTAQPATPAADYTDDTTPVRTSPGFADGYRAIAEGGWSAIAASPEHGGMGLPMAVTTAVNEMMASACLALAPSWFVRA